MFNPPIHRRLRPPRSHWRVLLLTWPVLLAACAAVKPAPAPAPESLLPMMGISIQAGAFANLDNAVRLTQMLQSRGLDATFFRDDDGLFKVRFGNFSSQETAQRRALDLQRSGMLEVFCIVVPEQYAAAEHERRGADFVRRSIVRTARGFLGVPYRWGGDSIEEGFDCSGLTMTAYRLNGYDLPRTSRAQYAAGAPVPSAALRPADLVFFSSPAKSSATHVGLYIGEGLFIHAPSSGKMIRIDALDQAYYRLHLIGVRRYI